MFLLGCDICQIVPIFTDNMPGSQNMFVEASHQPLWLYNNLLINHTNDAFHNLKLARLHSPCIRELFLDRQIKS